VVAALTAFTEHHSQVCYDGCNVVQMLFTGCCML
jgi:hypothetical protein